MGEQNLLYLCNESENQNSASYKFLGMDQSACSYKLFGLNAFLDRQTFHYIKFFFFFILWANIANAWLPMPEQRELYLPTETENQNFVFNIFLVLTHSACPYKNCGKKYFVDP